MWDYLKPPAAAKLHSAYEKVKNGLYIKWMKSNVQAEFCLQNTERRISKYSSSINGMNWEST